MEVRVHARDERGQALPLAAMLLVLVGVGFVLLAGLGEVIDDAARARTAADAAALAGAADGRVAASELAEANGATLVSFEARGSRVEVVVEIGDVTVAAAAERLVDWVPP